MKIDFENIQNRCEDACESSEYATLIDKVKKAKKIFLLGNGGLHFVSCHMATDLTRLIKDKVVYSFDSVGFITSNANDHGHEQVFLRWLETTILDSDDEGKVKWRWMNGTINNYWEGGGRKSRYDL